MISICAVSVFCDERVAFSVLSWVDACAGCAVGSHGLISIFSEVESRLLLVVVHALHHFRSDKRAFCDNAFQRHHVIEVMRGERSWVACVLAEVTHVCAVVHLVHVSAIKRI